MFLGCLDAAVGEDNGCICLTEEEEAEKSVDRADNCQDPENPEQ